MLLYRKKIVFFFKKLNILAVFKVYGLTFNNFFTIFFEWLYVILVLSNSWFIASFLRLIVLLCLILHNNIAKFKKAFCLYQETIFQFHYYFFKKATLWK